MKKLAILPPLLWLTLFLASPSSEGRGYVARPCGFDMNRNGVSAEPVDCKVCDGVTTDPDGDDNAEDLIYVDCDNGNDSTGDGSPGNPYLTLANAITQADGTGEEDIICFKGTCNGEENLLLTGMAGKAAAYSVSATGNQVRAFSYPSNPAMIVGWDADNDGEYPPYDTDDTAVIAATGGEDVLFDTANVASYFELAHFSARDYGKDDGVASSPGGFIQRPNDYWYFHDIEMSGINDGTSGYSTRIAFNMFGAPSYVAIENVQSLDTGAWWIRGSGMAGSPGSGPIRVQDATVEMRGLDASYPIAVKIWGWNDGFEMLDSEFICDIAGWNGSFTKPCNGIGPATCSRDWDIINNKFTDWGSSLYILGDDTTCEAPNSRSIDDVIFDRNLFINTSLDVHFEGKAALQVVTFGDEIEEVVENITISNNIFHWENQEWEVGLLFRGNYTGSGSVPGTITIVNNTFEGEIQDADGPIFTGHDPGYISIDDISDKTHENWIIKNNVMTGATNGCKNITVDYNPTNLDSDYNVFDDDCIFRWNQANSTFANWKSTTSGDANSVECDPTFVNAATDDFHLANSDTCALDEGVDVRAATPFSNEHDYDNTPRSQGEGWDIGADEVSVPPVEPPLQPPTRPHVRERSFE